MLQGLFGENITRALGRGYARSAVISSASLALLSLFYVYSAASYLEITVYPLIDRVTYYSAFNVYITNEYIDHVIIGSLLILWLAFSSKTSRLQYTVIGVFGVFFSVISALNYNPVLDGVVLASLPAIVSLLIFDRYYENKILRGNTSRLTLNYLAIIGSVIGIMGIVIALVPVLSVDPELVPPVRSPAYDIFLILSTFSAMLVVFLMTCFPVRYLCTRILKYLNIQRIAISDLDGLNVTRRNRIIYLSATILLSIFVTMIPHLTAVNPDNAQIGTDTGAYVSWISALIRSDSASEFLYQAFVVQNTGERPLALIFLYLLHILSGADLFYAVEYAPVVLAPSLVVTLFFLTRELTKSDVISLIAAFLTATSFHVLIGLYAGFYANWLALIFGYLSILFLFRSLKNASKVNLVVFGVLMMMTLFAHVYTWSIMAIVVGLFLAFILVRYRNQHYNGLKKKTIFLFLILFATVAVDVARTQFTGSSGGIERDIELQERFTGPDQFLLRWGNLNYTTSTYVGGLFANFIVLGLAVYWLIRGEARTETTIFVMIFLSIGILAFLFGNYVIQARVLYNIPLQIPAAMALAIIGRTSPNGGIRAIPIYVWIVMTTIVATSNFHLMLPG